MKAWQFTDTHSPLELVELPEPKATDEEVVVRVRAAGICHSDVGLFEDEKWMDVAKAPVVPGHEIAGEIVEVGSGVDGWSVGDRVMIWTMSDDAHGYRRNGGFGEFIAAHPESLVRMPDGLEYEKAIFGEPGMTAHSAVVVAGQLEAGQKVGIIGFGGLGQLATRVAALSGARVFVAEINEEIWDRARQAGAERVVRDITELTDEQLDLICDFAGFGTTTAGAISAVANRGRVIQVGMGKLEATIDTYPLIMKGVTLLGNVGGPKESAEAVVDWIGSGDIEPTVVRTDFDGIPEGIKRLQRGEAGGRLVAIY